jgi:hypothetical protein
MTLIEKVDLLKIKIHKLEHNKQKDDALLSEQKQIIDNLSRLLDSAERRRA